MLPFAKLSASLMHQSAGNILLSHYGVSNGQHIEKVFDSASDIATKALLFGSNDAFTAVNMSLLST